MESISEPDNCETIFIRLFTSWSQVFAQCESALQLNKKKCKAGGNVTGRLFSYLTYGKQERGVVFILYAE